jgi:class 3 adenylate cyclase/tetratricopeptide (TPR) repeat protein
MTEATIGCPACGTPVVPGARFCYQCGSSLGGAGEAAAQTAAERRIVTVLFGDLSDFTAWAEEVDPERVGTVTSRVLTALAQTVTDVGGTVDKLTGDGIMAVFGAPVAHEDDAERAVRAAARMQTAVRRLMQAESGGGQRLGLRVGLNTGEVLAGVQAEMAYTVVGDTVNTASRLSDAAGIGAVYAGRDTAQATMPVASWRSLPPMRLKGKHERVAAFELLGLRPPGSSRIGVGEEAPFVGREAELGRLIGRVREAADTRSPGAVLVTGEAGIGKTRLLVELSRALREQPDGQLLWGRCTPYGEGRHLAPILDWVRTSCGITEDDSTEVAIEKVRRTAGRLRPSGSGPSPAAVGERLTDLLGLDRPAPAPRAGAVPGTSGGLPLGAPALDAVRMLAEGSARDGPVVLIVDEMQWATPTLLQAVARVTGRMAGPVLLVAAGRGEVFAADADPDWWRRLPEPELLPLTPLDAVDSDRLLCAYLGGDELDSSVRERLVFRAGGNPFFLSELVQLLVDRGLLRRTGQRWSLAGELPDDVLPAGVQAVLTARIDGLDAAAKAVLRDAAILGYRFRLPAVAALAGRDGDEVRAALDRLSARGIVVQPDEAEPAGYAFRHTLLRDAAYAGIPKGARARSHAAAAVWAAEHLDGPPEENATFVAGQGERAAGLAAEMGLPVDDPAWRARSLAAAALAQLAGAARAREEHQTAEQLCSRGLTLAPDGAQALREELLLERAIARAALARLDDADADLAEPLAADRPQVRAGALVARGEVQRRQADEDAARTTLVAGLAAARDAGADRVTGEALRQLGLLDYLSGRLRAAEDRFQEAFELAQSCDDPRGAGWALQQLAWSATTRADYPRAERTLSRAADVFSELDDSGGLAWCAGTEALIRLLQGRLVDARNLATGLLPMGEVMGERWGVAACRTIAAFAAAELGDVGVAAQQAEQARESFGALGDRWGAGLADVARAAAERGAGGPDRGLAAAESALATADAQRYPVTGSLAMVVAGYCQLDLRRFDDAERCAGQALTALAELDLEPNAAVGAQVLLAQALRGRGELDWALALLEKATESSEQPSLIFPRRQATAHRAGALLDSGRRSEAVAAAHQAMRVPAEDVRSRIVSLRVLAQCYAASGDPVAARAALRQGVALAYSTDQVSERPATERALEELGSN